MNKIFKELIINNKLFKTKITFLLSKTLSPAELFCFEYVFNSVLNIKYQIKTDEELLKEENEIILWEDMLYLKSDVFFINNIETLKLNLLEEKYILIGNSSNWLGYKEKLEKELNPKIYTYENSHTILFERV